MKKKHWGKISINISSSIKSDDMGLVGLQFELDCILENTVRTTTQKLLDNGSFAKYENADKAKKIKVF